MDFQRAELWRILSDKGWKVEIIDNYDFQQWSKESWLLRSLWSQVDTTAYLMFKLDPMEMSHKEESVWAVALYSEPPHYGVRDRFTMPLNHWRNYLPDFLHALEEMRNSA